MNRRNAFTLIELLIAVAIIAILAAIAVPNFLAAQTRSKVSRAAADMRTLATALESYRTDSQAYPPNCGVGPGANPLFMASPITRRLSPLTTPVSYVAILPTDIFRAKNEPLAYDTYDYFEAVHSIEGSGLTSGGAWRLCSSGPDLVQAWGGRTWHEVNYAQLGVDYDPTNGTVSTGDIVRAGPWAPTANGKSPADPTNDQRPAHYRAR